ncbi:Auxin-responsive protein iaa26 [Sarracenia purpurea var. burkii]
MEGCSKQGERGFNDTVETKTVEKKGWIVSINNGSQNQKKLSVSENPVGTVLSSPWSSSSSYQQQLKSSPGQSLTVVTKESSQCCTATATDLLEKAAKKAFPTTVPNSNGAQKRTGPAPVVGWPPIRSFRKNLASSSSSKPITPESQNVVPSKVLCENPVESCIRGFFVKINMDGVPIGRKVDLEAYGSYEKLSSAVDELFRDLLAAQRDSSTGGIQKKQEGEEKAITGLLDGSGEYTLVYEDNEGDRILVGDVPWHMFVSTVKRLRVLKSSELSAMCLCSKRGKVPPRDPPK